MFTDFFNVVWFEYKHDVWFEYKHDVWLEYKHDVWLEYKHEISVLLCENLWKNSSLPKNDPLVTGYGIYKRINSIMQQSKSAFGH